MSTLSEHEMRFRVHAHHRNQGTLLAFRSPDGRGIGAARYVRQPHDPESAEVTVAVEDEWRDAGLAAELVRQLAAHARARGIRRLVVVLPTDVVEADDLSPWALSA